MDIAGLIIIGIVAGIMAGLFGIGGGIIIVPALIFFLNFTLLQANGTSLAALLLPVSIFAVWVYYKAGFVNIKAALIIAFGILLGVSSGTTIALNLPTQILKILYGIFLIYVGLNFTNGINYMLNIFSKKQKSPKIEKNAVDIKYRYVILIGIFAGFMSGMFGIGGGLIIVPLLMYVYKFSTKSASGTSLAALLLPVALPGVLMYYNSGNLNIMTAIPLAGGIILGSLIGANIAISLPPASIKKIYGYFLIIMGLYFMFQKLIFSIL